MAKEKLKQIEHELTVKLLQNESPALYLREIFITGAAPDGTRIECSQEVSRSVLIFDIHEGKKQTQYLIDMRNLVGAVAKLHEKASGEYLEWAVLSPTERKQIIREFRVPEGGYEKHRWKSLGAEAWMIEEIPSSTEKKT